MDSLFYPDKHNKLIKKRKGLEGYSFDTPSLVTQEQIDTFIQTYFNSGGAVGCDSVCACDCIQNLINAQSQDIRYWGAEFTLTTSPQTFNWSDLTTPAGGSLPASISRAILLSSVFYDERAFRVTSYNNTQVTIEVLLAGVAEYPIDGLVEVAGYGLALPNTIYSPHLIGLTLAQDRGVYVSSYNKTSVTLKLFQVGIEKFPISVKVVMAGKENESDILYKCWVMDVIMNSSPETFTFAGVSNGSSGKHTYAVTLEIDDWSKTYNFGSLVDVLGKSVPPNITDAYIAGYSPRIDRHVYFSAFTDTSMTVGAFHPGIAAADFPYKFSCTIRGGA